MAKIDKTVSKSLRAGQLFLEQGYILCDIDGIVDNEARSTDGFGVLSREYVPLTKREKTWFSRFFRFVFCLPRRRYFLGVVWFYNLRKNVTSDKIVFEVYGKNHHDQLLGIAREIASELNTDVDVCLASERTKHEKLPYPR